MIKLKQKHSLILAALSSLLLILPWLQQFSGVILFVAFIPLLVIEHNLYESRQNNKSIQIFIYAYLIFFIWNFATTYWIYNATIAGAIAAILLNSLFMALVIWLFHITHRLLGHRYGYFGLITYWTGFELLYLKADISWPWLNLGNGLAKDIKLIQWIEFTGITSATPWILLINILLFTIILEYAEKLNIRKKIFELIILLVVALLPIGFSIYKYHSYNESNDPFEITILQPNIDPYNEKPTKLTNQEKLDIILDLANSNVDLETEYVIAPEAAIEDNIWENNLPNNRSIKRINEFVKSYPDLKFIVGMQSLYSYQPDEPPSSTARKFSDSDGMWDLYNSSIQIDNSNNFQVYHKSKLVIGVEKMPSGKVFKILEKVITKFGGASGSYGTQNERNTLNDPIGNGKVGTLICYESVYGEFVTDYIKKGANMLFIITNDGWWGNTLGYKQHLSYSGLRAIETRRSIARSASTGISCFINQKGEISMQTEYGKKSAIEAYINANSKLTYYVKHGNFISRILLFFGILTLLYTIAKLLMGRKLLKP